MVENKGKVDEMLISLQEKNTELENDINTGKERLDVLDDNLNNVEDNAKYISGIKNQSDKRKESIDNFVKKIANVQHKTTLLQKAMKQWKFVLMSYLNQ
jgi:t-SNARE complex subunit (syntaxin)